jgi:hypothetical protein
VDYLLERPDGLVPVEIKSGETIRRSMFDGLDYWSKLTGDDVDAGFLVHGGREDQHRTHGRVLGWRSLGQLLGLT